MTSIDEPNFAARLVGRLGPCSYLIDAVTGQSISPDELPRLIAAYGSSLLSAGLKEGDRVLLGCSLSIPSVLAYLGSLYAGLVAVPVEDRALRESGTILLQATGSRAVWTEAGLREEWTHKLAVPLLQGDLAKDAPEIKPPAACAPSDLAALMPTSGSTGAPRFVMVSHANLIANTEAIIRSQGLTGDDRAIVILPLSYCFGASLIHTHFYQGGGVVLDRRFMFPNKVLRSVAELGCTTFAGVPTAYNVLLRQSNIRQIDMPGLRRFLQAGGALGPGRIREVRAILPHTKFYVMYGQTEATARISCMEPERWEEKSGSVGRPLDNLIVRIVDENRNDLPTGHIGELLVKGPSVCSGYWNNPIETNRILRDGWLQTGDLARQDEEGYLWIEGRKGAFLKMRGIRVSFSEVEARVVGIPGVYECVARRVEHPEAGEALALSIVPDPGAGISAENVRHHLPAHWAIHSIDFVSELPKTSTGKMALSSLPR